MSQNTFVVEEFLKRTLYFVLVSLLVLSTVTIALIADLIRKIFLRREVIPHGKAVFITGCDTGFGNSLARRLDAKGFQVFATCLFPEGTGATKLRESCSNRLRVLHMDVTKDESVEKAFEYVKENLGFSVPLKGLMRQVAKTKPSYHLCFLLTSLWAVVNNAGILKGFSVEIASLDDFRDCLDVNLMGCVRVTKAFLPLLKQTKGRIVNITSIAGELSLPFYTPYTVSKYAAVGFTDCLRFELERWGISVVSIEPEMFATGLICPETISKNLDDKLKAFEDDHDDYASSLKDIAKFFLSFACPKISQVVKDLESAVSLQHPHHTYKPRRHMLGRFICFCYQTMPRSCQILLMKLVFFLFFSEFKEMKNISMKIASWI